MAARRHLLAERRKTVGHTQEQLAELVGVERSTVVRWEAGETEPKPWSRPKLAQALAVSVDELHRLLTVPENDEQQPGQRVERKVVLVDPMRRRTLVKWGLGTTAVAGLGIGSAAKVGAADVARLQRTDARLNRLTDQHGGDTVASGRGVRRRRSPDAGAGHLR